MQSKSLFITVKEVLTIVYLFMIRTVIKPENHNITISLPENFIGKQVEVIAFTVEEAKESTGQLVTHFASEAVLAKDWLTPEEDTAWQDL